VTGTSANGYGLALESKPPQRKVSSIVSRGCIGNAKGQDIQMNNFFHAGGFTNPHSTGGSTVGIRPTHSAEVPTIVTQQTTERKPAKESKKPGHETKSSASSAGLSTLVETK
jgi:hypothetical protein